MEQRIERSQVAHALFSLHVTTELGALPFLDFGEGGRRGCFRAFASTRCSVRLDFDRAGGSSQVMTEAGPNTFPRCNNEASADWVAVPKEQRQRQC